ncbi:MAG: hypothetical protein HC767_07605 [Akkermansiaceae bacterium]|nr:hypothetical protein [Akkermansiaceae bacterium]
MQDPNRPAPTKTFEKEYKFTVGGVDIELVDAPFGHTPGDIYMYLPQKKTVMVVDIIFPGWVPFRSFALASAHAHTVPLTPIPYIPDHHRLTVLKGFSSLSHYIDVTFFPGERA